MVYVGRVIVRFKGQSVAGMNHIRELVDSGTSHSHRNANPSPLPLQDDAG